MHILLAALPVFIILVTAELWWRRQSVNGEFSRKLVHISVGSYVAFWPFYLSWYQVQLFSLAFLLVVGVSKQIGLFQAIHSVQRPTWGEAYFAVAVGALTLITTDKWVYAASLMQMSLADGLAAVVGVRFGQGTSYLIWGSRKSVVGSLAFFVTSLLILALYSQYGNHLSVLAIVGTAALASVVENMGRKGTDNLFVPVIVCLLLTHL